MNNPVLSFTISILFWFLIVGSVSFFSVKNKLTLNSESTISIDAEMIGEVVEKKKKPSSKKKFEKIGGDKNKVAELSKKEIDSSNQDQSNTNSQSPKILHRPLPNIPSDLRREAFQTKAIVRFYVGKNGVVKKFEFVKSSSNPRLNFLLMKQLKKWKFESTDKDFEKDVVVNFVVR